VASAPLSSLNDGSLKQQPLKSVQFAAAAQRRKSSNGLAMKLHPTLASFY
jgi:hypothetical protein